MTDDMTLKIAEEYVRRKCEWDCDMNKQCGSCMIRCVKQTIEMARKQQAEIDDLKKVIETMTNEQQQFGIEAKTKIEKAKADAIKEFAERLKQCTLYVDGEGDLYKINSDAIDNLVKEMVGDAE